MLYDQTFIKKSEAAKRLNLDEMTLTRAVKRGELAAIDLGNGQQFTPAMLDAWLSNKVINPELLQQNTAGGE